MQRMNIVSFVLGLTLIAGAGCGDFLEEIEQAVKDHGGSSGTGTGGTGGGAPQHCGGNIANPPQCPAGYQCVPDPANGNLPFGDVGGICQKQSTSCNTMKCGPTEHVCDCVGGAYCLPAGAACIAPTSTCPSTPSALACPSGQHLCACATGAYCLAGNAACLTPNSPCPPCQ